MASGSFTVYTNNQYIRGTVSWTATKDEANNRSLVKMTLRMYRTNTGYTTVRVPIITFTIDGTSYTYNTGEWVDITYNSNTFCGSYERYVSHNSDGSKVCPLKISGRLDGSTDYPLTTKTVNATLDTIPRATAITSFPNFVLGQNIAVKLGVANAGFRHTMVLTIGSIIVATRVNIADDFTLVLSTSEQNTIYNYLRNETSWTIILHCSTFYSGSQIGDTTERSATVSISTSIIPSFDELQTYESNPNVPSGIGGYISGISTLGMKIIGAIGAKYSTIVEYRFYVSNWINWASSTKNYTGSGAIPFTSNFTLTATVVDSRGRTASKSVTIVVIEYIPPKITAFSIERCNSDGTENPVGEYAKISSSYSWINPQNKNPISVAISSRERPSGIWEEKYNTEETIETSGTIIQVISLYDITKSYDIRLAIRDIFNTTLSTKVMSTGEVPMSWGRSGVGIGKIWEGTDTLEVGGTIRATTKITSSGDIGVGGNARIYGGIRVEFNKVNYISSGNDANDLTEMLLLGSGTNFPSGSFWYVQSIMYNGPNIMKQIAYGYINSRVASRYCYNGVWSAWVDLTLDTI